MVETPTKLCIPGAAGAPPALFSWERGRVARVFFCFLSGLRAAPTGHSRMYDVWDQVEKQEADGRDARAPTIIASGMHSRTANPLCTH